MDIYEVELCRRGRWEQQDARFIAAGDADEAAYKVTGEHLHSEGARRKVRLRVRRLGNGSPPPKLFTPSDHQRTACDLAEWEMEKMKMADGGNLLVGSVETASAQYYNPYGPGNFYYQYYWGAPAELDNLAYTKALRDKARKEREETGKSDVGARLRLQQMRLSAASKTVCGVPMDAAIKWCRP